MPLGVGSGTTSGLTVQGWRCAPGLLAGRKAVWARPSRALAPIGIGVSFLQMSGNGTPKALFAKQSGMAMGMAATKGHKSKVGGLRAVKFGLLTRGCLPQAGPSIYNGMSVKEEEKLTPWTPINC